MTTSQFVLDHSTSGRPRSAITSDDHAGVAVLNVYGDLDQATEPRFVQSVDCAMSASPSVLIIDLSDTRFLGCAGMAALLMAKEKAQANGIGYAVAAVGPTTARPMHELGLSTEIAIYPTVAGALRATREATPKDPPTPPLAEAGGTR
ncbi:STAS domain-containing protein [Williamsia soli]|uniref:STAS domain-containing protein n=1 Tax=Williamsia soli TaxID=364929 RepID=UPI001A9E43CC|nr:STAS domain-containing protein [Williamsia soli]